MQGEGDLVGPSRAIGKKVKIESSYFYG